MLPSGNVWNNNHQNQEFSNGTKSEGDVKTNNLSGSVTLTGLLFDGGKMFVTRNQAEELVRLGELGIKDQVVNTVAQVINSYYIIVRQKQQLKAIEEQMSISQTRVDLTQRRLEIGVGAQTRCIAKQSGSECANSFPVSPAYIDRGVKRKIESNNECCCWHQL